MLSDDTVTYKSGLIDEFGDLRNIFQGQTRLKEIELLEEKIPDLYLTDSQKEAILNSRINASKRDIIYAQAAREIEDEPLGILAYQQRLDEIASPKMKALFDQILDEQKSIIQNAENRKKVGLDLNDPEDLQIIDQILKEAGGDPYKAKKLAEKKGYKL